MGLGVGVRGQSQNRAVTFRSGAAASKQTLLLMPGTFFRPLLSVTALVFLSGCTSMGTLQTPDVPRAGSAVVGLDFELPANRLPVEAAPAPIGDVVPRIAVEIGLGRGIGVSATGGTAGIGGNLKISRRAGPFVVAATGGRFTGRWNYCMYGGCEGRSTQTSNIALLAGLPLNGEHVRPYFALRQTYVASDYFESGTEWGPEHTLINQWIPSISLGLRKPNLRGIGIFELSLFRFQDQWHPVVGMSVRFGRGYAPRP